MEASPSSALLREYLAEHDAPCPACGYNLRGLTGAACPECNSGLSLRVGLVEPRLGAYVTGLVGWSMGAGFNGLLLVFFLIVIIAHDDVFEGDAFLLHNLIGCVAQGSGLAAWVLRLGPRVRRPGVSGRWLIVATGWIASLANVVLFAMWIR